MRNSGSVPVACYIQPYFGTAIFPANLSQSYEEYESYEEYASTDLLTKVTSMAIGVTMGTGCVLLQCGQPIVE